MYTITLDRFNAVVLAGYKSKGPYFIWPNKTRVNEKEEKEEGASHPG